MSLVHDVAIQHLARAIMAAGEKNRPETLRWTTEALTALGEYPLSPEDTVTWLWSEVQGRAAMAIHEIDRARYGGGLEAGVRAATEAHELACGRGP